MHRTPVCDKNLSKFPRGQLIKIAWCDIKYTVFSIYHVLSSLLSTFHVLAFLSRHSSIVHAHRTWAFIPHHEFILKSERRRSPLQLSIGICFGWTPSILFYCAFSFNKSVRVALKSGQGKTFYYHFSEFAKMQKNRSKGNHSRMKQP